MRGGARQNNGMTATYRSCNFGDSATMFSVTQSYTSPRNMLDNYYSVYSGAGMTWYKFDLWHQYMSGSAFFYHEQGFDEFWKPGGTAAAGLQNVQLSPKGKLVDRFLRLTANDFDRGRPYTPVAFLVDYAHGWEPGPFWPNSFNNWHQHPDRFRYGEHERMLEQYFHIAWHPIGPISQQPITATNEVYVPGVFGDIFDVIFAYPDASRWQTIDAYPVVIATGDIELSEAEGQRLAAYVENGGTLFVADTHLTGPGVAALHLPAAGEFKTTDAYDWLPGSPESVSDAGQRFQYRPISLSDGEGRPLAKTGSGDVFCAVLDRGRGRLVYLSVPRGLSITGEALPVVARLIAQLTRGLMPVDVAGDVEWLVNQTARGWMVTLLNPAGQAKPQQGITPTDYRENRPVTIRSHLALQSARDRLSPTDELTVENGVVHCIIPAGGVRIVELR